MTGTEAAPVVVRFAALGDTVLLTVLLDALARRYGRPIDVLTSGLWARTLLSVQPFVHEVCTVTSRKRPWLLTPSQWHAVSWLKGHSGPVWLCDPEPAARRLVERAVPASRIRALWDDWPGEDVHWADWWYAVAHDRPIVPGVGVPVLHLPELWRADARRWLARQGIPAAAPLILIQPGSKKTSRRFSLNRVDNDKFWPLERWATVVEGLLDREPHAHVVLCGLPTEADVTGGIWARLGVRARARVIDAARELPLPRLAGLAGLASAMISVDTGPAHLAAALDCPLVVLFGKHGYARWAPRAPSAPVIALGHPTYREEGHVGEISAQAVLEAFEALWRRCMGSHGEHRSIRTSFASIA
ncbi:MAG: glycosyltransferase family 9 protein [Casimicrobiaceae bacterium]|nr:glycosyltransferase family 9 protein [Casimicrobiaceae bacterium]MDW8313083.1 glycosyltransferase family 9 protein [Burkholderiales bacterium]